MEAGAEVAAMQFAGGLAIAEVARLWQQDVDWVEKAVRGALLERIARRDGGLKASRTEMRAARRGSKAFDSRQRELEW
jgi:hypothetical protein